MGGFRKCAAFALAMLLLCACSKPDDNSHEWITPSASVDFSGMELYWQNEYIPIGYGAKISLYVGAEKDDEGNFGFDDGQDWLLTAETPDGWYPLFPRGYVQLGMVSYTAFYEYDGDAYSVFHVLVTVSQGAGLEIYDCVFDGDKKAFKVIPVYKAENINFLGDSRLR
ncbi:MAG: hypothetical protein FWH16_03135 [Oscillospiraceae bacterium]|nr:hypothetical protein [Oscillospiraceae bacterium]